MISDHSNNQLEEKPPTVQSTYLEHCAKATVGIDDERENCFVEHQFKCIKEATTFANWLREQDCLAQLSLENIKAKMIMKNENDGFDLFGLKEKKMKIIYNVDLTSAQYEAIMGPKSYKLLLTRWQLLLELAACFEISDNLEERIQETSGLNLLALCVQLKYMGDSDKLNLTTYRSKFVALLEKEEVSKVTLNQMRLLTTLLNKEYLTTNEPITKRVTDLYYALLFLLKSASSDGNWIINSFNSLTARQRAICFNDISFLETILSKLSIDEFKKLCESLSNSEFALASEAEDNFLDILIGKTAKNKDEVHLYHQREIEYHHHEVKVSKAAKLLRDCIRGENKFEYAQIILARLSVTKLNQLFELNLHTNLLSDTINNLPVEDVVTLLNKLEAPVISAYLMKNESRLNSIIEKLSAAELLTLFNRFDNLADILAKATLYSHNLEALKKYVGCEPGWSDESTCSKLNKLFEPKKSEVEDSKDDSDNENIIAHVVNVSSRPTTSQPITTKSSWGSKLTTFGKSITDGAQHLVADAKQTGKNALKKLGSK